MAENMFASPLSGVTSEEHVADRLHSAAIHLLRRVARQDAATGLGPARLSALSVIVFGGPLTLGQLAAAERVRPSTMTPIVQGLEAEGLVGRSPGDRDKRTTLLGATDEGRQVLDAARRRRVQDLAALLERLPRSQLDTLERATTVIENALRDGGNPPKAVTHSRTSPPTS
jgi:DNA-binding MarR family transcriptional regulator